MGSSVSTASENPVDSQETNIFINKKQFKIILLVFDRLGFDILIWGLMHLI